MSADRGDRCGFGIHMGKPTGFMEIQRKKHPTRPVAERLHDWARGVPALPTAGARRTGGAVHGLRHPVLSSGLPARQPDSRLERSRLSRSLAGRDRSAARDEQLSRVHRTAVPGAVRRRVRARHQQRSGHDQGRSKCRSSSARSTKAGSPPSRPRCAPASASPSSAPGRPASRPPSS